LFIPAALAALSYEAAIVCGEAFIVVMGLAYRYYPVIYELQLLLSETGAVTSMERRAAAEAVRLANSTKMTEARHALMKIERVLSELPAGLQAKVKEAVLESLRMLGQSKPIVRDEIKHHGEYASRHVHRLKQGAGGAHNSGARAANSANLERLKLPAGVTKHKWTPVDGKFWRQADSGVPIEAIRPLNPDQYVKAGKAAESLTATQTQVHKANAELMNKLDQNKVAEYLEVAADGTVFHVMSAPGVSPVKHALHGGMAGPQQYVKLANSMLSKLPKPRL
jgi:hypothetical protein